MKSLFEAIALILLTCFIIALIFIFKGDPDLWDRMHDAAMDHTELKETCKAQRKEP